MDKLYISMHDEAGPITDPVQQQQLEHNHSLEARKRCMQVLQHAVSCRNPNCPIPPCQTVRYAYMHMSLCKRTKKKGCPVCQYARQCLGGRSWLPCRATRGIFIVGISMGRRRDEDDVAAPSSLQDGAEGERSAEEQAPNLCLHDYTNLEV